MDQVTIRQTSADLPGLDAEAGLEPVSEFEAESRLVVDFQFSGVTLPAFDLAGSRLLRGRIREVNAGHVTISAAQMDSVELTGCTLSSLRWTGGKLSRVRFDTCRLLGARFEGVTMEHVVFTGCKLDYATLDQVRAAGPVLFADCSLREAELTGCDLAGSLLDGCDLRLTTFGPGRYRGCDLRGNDLSDLIGAAHLRHVIIDHIQTMQLGEALAAELEVTFDADPPGRP